MRVRLTATVLSRRNAVITFFFFFQYVHHLCTATLLFRAPPRFPTALHPSSTPAFTLLNLQWFPYLHTFHPPSIISLLIYRKVTGDAVATSSIYPASSHPKPLRLCRKKKNNPAQIQVLTLHCGHFWAFLCPCSMTLAQFRNSLSPFLYSRHLSPLCQGAWHLKHHTNWQLLHWIYMKDKCCMFELITK